MTWPSSTYRLQFGKELDFRKAAGLADYLAGLGVTHLYASPVFEAMPGSPHGYDVTDPCRLSEALGGEEGFSDLVRALRGHGLGLILDIVPNHMAASPHNPWFADVLARGQSSAFARLFDIDWERGGGQVVLPLLGAPLEACIAQGDLILEGEALVYFDSRFPLRPGTAQGPIEDVLAAQAYRLCHWRDLEALNYRRFFDITGLIGIRQEDPEVFEKTHALIARLIGEGAIDGVRVDHVDGLRDPRTYLDRLAALFPGAPAPPPIWVEKILEPGERLPADWPVAGETGYAALGLIDRVLMDGRQEARFDALCRRYAGSLPDLGALAPAVKREIIGSSFAAEFGRLAHELAAQTGHPVSPVEHVLREIAAHMPVYRTYLRAGGGDVAALSEAVAQVDAPAEELDAVMAALTSADPASGSHDLAMRFQQLTGPVMAKAVEDTAFYRHPRFIALNEVGGDPDRFSLDPSAFHEAIAGLPPLGLVASATHDTKRGDGTRLRLIAASHRPDLWERTVQALEEALAGEGAILPPADRYMLIQAALGIHDPGADRAALAERLALYAVKAAREAKQATSWTDTNERHEAALTELAGRLEAEPAAGLLDAFAAALVPLEEGLDVARLVLKHTIPGIPDLYQGTEWIERTLVDPDNRRPVDFAARRAALTAGTHPRLGLLQRLLRLRQDHAALFRTGDYRPDPAPEGQLAFRRAGAGEVLVVALRIAPDAPALPAEGEGRIILSHPFAILRLTQPR